MERLVWFDYYTHTSVSIVYDAHLRCITKRARESYSEIRNIKLHIVMKFSCSREDRNFITVYHSNQDNGEDICDRLRE